MLKLTDMSNLFEHCKVYKTFYEKGAGVFRKKNILDETEFSYGKTSEENG